MRAVDLVQPARLARREDRVREQRREPAALFTLSRASSFMLVGQEPVAADPPTASREISATLVSLSR